MKYLSISAALLGTALCLYGWNRLDEPAFTVHEWGTFTSVAGPDGKPAEWNTLGCSDDLPSFVKNQGFRKFQLRGTVRMETPVLYFYSDKPAQARVKASLPNGLITEFYPKAAFTVAQKGQQPSPDLNGFSTYLKDQTGAVEWKSVKVEPYSSPDFPTEARPSRYYAARATDAAPVTVDNQHEKFLFYRGVARVPLPLNAAVQQDGSVQISNAGANAVTDVFLFENRGGSIGYRRLHGEATAERPTLNGSSAQLHAELESTLIAHGLYPKEAAAMIDTWRDSWFEKGARLIYIVPERDVNAMVPLEIEPAPANIKRVFVGRVELITAETVSAVRTAVAKNDRLTLRAYERFLDPIAEKYNVRVNLSCSALQ